MNPRTLVALNRGMAVMQTVLAIWNTARGDEAWVTYINLMLAYFNGYWMLYWERRT